MVANRILIGLGAIILMATAALAQNTSNPALSGNTANPVLSGNSTVLSGRSELSVPPALPNTLIQPNPGRNSANGLPCTGVGLLSVSPTLPGTTVAPGATGGYLESAGRSLDDTAVAIVPKRFQSNGIVLRKRR